jgi:putative ATPase
MKSLGYGKNYKYAHDYDDALADQEYLPEELAGSIYYKPTDKGRELKIAEYLKKYREFRQKLTSEEKKK